MTAASRMKPPDDYEPSRCEWHSSEIEEMRKMLTSLAQIAAANQTNITALQEWQRAQNGSLKDIKTDVSAIRQNFNVEVQNIRDKDIGGLRTAIDKLQWWLIGVLVTIVVAYGALFFQHVVK